MNKKNEIDKATLKKCHKIIHAAAATTGGVAAASAQIPGGDTVVITPIQAGMIISLGKIFNIEISRATATALAASFATAVVGRSISQLLVGWIPGIGNFCNMTTAASLTELIGWGCVNQFAEKKIRIDYTPKEQKNQNEDLFKRAYQFINGEKEAQGKDKEEYSQLLLDFEYKYAEEIDNKEFEDVYNKLRELLKGEN